MSILPKDWRPRGVTVNSVIRFDVRDCSVYLIHNEKDENESDFVNADRVGITQSEPGGDTIYIDGPGLEHIASWLEQAARKIRAEADQCFGDRLGVRETDLDAELDALEVPPILRRQAE